MKKSYILFASAALLFAGCANDEFTGDKGLSSDNAPIAFNMQTGAQTRATTETGLAAATKLGNEFIVWGEKNETDGSKATDGNLVFENYVVKYTSTSENKTENTTLSNTKGWEYVGFTPYASDKVSPSILTASATATQTIKYWDMKADSYTFTAVSAKSTDISGEGSADPKVKIEKNEGGETTTSATDKGYTITVKSGASTGNIYVADRVVLTSTDSKQEGTINRTAENKYGGLVKFAFRNFETKIRFGIYETVPGYKVVITGIKYNETAHPSETSTDDKAFGVDGNFIVAGSDEKTTTYTVTYEGASSTNPNKAVMTVNDDPNKQIYMTTGGTNWLSTKWTSKEDNECIGSSATDATYDKTVDTDKKAYTAILPNKDNETNLKLTVKYDLYSEDTGEKISVDYKTVEVPAKYCQWKNNYAYTYLFKITDSSAELYPITFDAVVETDENGNQETITTVTEPSITTFGVKDKKIITDKDEYPAGTDIYASVVVNGTVASDLSTSAALYTVTTDNATDFPITEASVANAIAQAAASPAVTGKVKATKVETTSEATDKPSFVTSVPAEDGSTRILNAMKWTGTVTSGSETYYAVEYNKDGKKTYKIVKVVPATSTPTPMPGE